MRSLLALLTASLLTPAGFAGGADPTYWQDIRPVFRKYCTVCHNVKNLREPDVSGGLALDSYEATVKGSSRPIFTAGKSEGSVLLHVLTTTDVKKRMPQDSDPLSAEKIALIRRWIDTGAKEGKKPDDVATPVASKKPASSRKLDVLLPTTTMPPAGLFPVVDKLILSLKAGPLPPVAAVAFSPDGSLLATGAYGQVTIWDLKTARPVKALTNVLGAVNDLKFSPDGKLLVVAGGQPSAKGDLRLFQVSDWKLIGHLPGHDDAVFTVAFRPGTMQLASASFDKTVRLWDLATLKPLRTFTSHSDFVYAVAFSPDGKVLASGGKDRTARLTEVDSGKSLFTVSDREQDVVTLGFNSDGKQLVVSGLEPSLSWWNTQTGEKLRSAPGHGVAVNEVVFSKDGQLLASAGSDRTIRLWNPAGGPATKVIAVGSVTYAVAISPDKKRIVSGSFDGLARIWDTDSGRLLVTLASLPMTEGQHDWLALTPEGYVAGSPGLANLAKWRVGSREVPGERVWPVVRHTEMVARSLRGETLPVPFKK